MLPPPLSPSPPLPLSIAACVHTACLLEATAAKPGNVQRGADFADLAYPDFLLAAYAIAPVMERAVAAPLGRTILDSVAATRAVVQTNVNLGIILLLAPLASVPRETDLQTGMPNVFSTLTPDDTRLVYEAIALARPGGMGTAPQADLAGPPPESLLAAMELAAERDTIARQYANGFADTWNLIVPTLRENLASRPTLSAIVRSFLAVLAALPDTLIARKCGPLVAQQASDWAADVLAAEQENAENYYHALADLDFWLRSDGHRRNPGTTADLMCAGLFVALRDGWLTPPFVWE